MRFVIQRVTSARVDIDGQTKASIEKGFAVLIGIGAAAQIACGPLIVVGRKKMYQSVDLYNVTCRKRAQVQPYWSIQTSNNGLGFAVNF